MANQNDSQVTIAPTTDPTATTVDESPGRGTDRLPRPELLRPPYLDTLRARLAKDLFGTGEAPRIGRFRILEMLGHGAMGQVYAAYDEELDRRVAVKVLLPSRSDDHGSRLRLMREALAQARLSHPNVVQIYEVGEHAGQIYVAMEYVRGRNVAEWLRVSKDGPRPWEEVLAVFVSAGRGLAAAHRSGLVHRDFKPANVLIGDSGKVCVADFGLARLQGDDTFEVETDGDREPAPRLTPETLTATGAIVGTPAYMAPELFEGQRGDEASDQYAFCVALYEALYGQWPHLSETPTAFVLAKIRGDVRPPPAGTRVPAWLHAAILRGLSVKPQDRWLSMTDLLAEIGRDRRAVRRRWAQLAAAVVLSAATLIAGVSAWRAASESRAKEEAARAERARAQRAAEQAERAEFERTVLVAAGQAADVLRLAHTPGRQRDALVLAIETLALHGPDFADAPRAALDGLSDALPALIPARTITSHRDEVRDLVISPDGTYFVTLDRGGEIRRWDMESGAGQWTVPGKGDSRKGHGEGLRRADSDRAGPTLSPDGARLMISGDRCMQWNTADGATLIEIPGCRDAIFADGGSAFVGKRRGEATEELAAWETESGALRWSSVLDGGQFDIVASADGTRVIVGRDDGGIELRSVVDGRTVARLPLPRSERSDAGPPADPRLQVSHDGRSLVASRHGEMFLWDLVDGDARRLDGGFRSVFTPDDGLIFSLSSNRLQVHERETAALQVASPLEGFLQPVAVAGDVMVALDHYNTLVRWDILTLKEIDRTQADEYAVYAMGASADGRRMVTSGEEGLKIWRVDDPRALGRWESPAGETIVDFGPDFVATADASGSLRLYDPDTRALRFSLDGLSWPGQAYVRAFEGMFWIEQRFHDPWVTRFTLVDQTSGEVHFRSESLEWEEIAWAAPRVARKAPDSRIGVFDVRSGELLCEIQDGNPRWGLREMPKVAISPDGGLVTVYDRAGSFATFSVDRCQRLAMFTASALLELPDSSLWTEVHFGFEGDGSLLVTGGSHALLVDPATGMEKLHVHDACRSQRTAWVSPDGDRLLTECANRLQVWDTRTGALLSTVAGIGWSDSDSRRFSADRERVVLDAGGGAVIVELGSGDVGSRYSGKDILSGSHARSIIDSDGALVRYRARDGSIVTYAPSWSGQYWAACRALAGTEVSEDVADECAEAYALHGGYRRGEWPH